MRPAFARNFQAHGKRLTGSSTPLRLFLRQIAERIASLVVSFGSLRARTLGDALLDGRVRALLFRREVAVGLALFEKTERRCSVLWRVVGLKDYLLVVIKAEPFETFDDRARRGFCRTLQVCVFDAQQKKATHFARIQPIEERGAR